jgi:signal peptide peptidase SppA
MSTNFPLTKPTRTKAERPAAWGAREYLTDLGRRFGARPLFVNPRAFGQGMTNDKRAPYDVAEGVAIINVTGMLCSDPCWWDETGYDELRYELAYAEQDPSVKSVLLRVNSPGGEVDGMFETADFIAKMTKTVWAVCDPIAYSAAYCLASQAERIYVLPVSGGVGSIGVYCLHFDYSEYLKNEGIKPTFITAGEGKVDGNPYEPLSEKALADLQEEIDRFYGEFVARVARGRNLGESAIVKLGARCYDGSQRALGAGLADQVGTLEAAWLDLATRVVTAQNGTAAATGPKGVATMDEPNETAATAKTEAAPPAPVVAAPAAAAPPSTETLIAEAKAAGFTEAQTVASICTAAGRPDLIAKYLGEKLSAAQAAEALLKDKAAKTDTNTVRGETFGHTAADANEKPNKSLAERNRATLQQQGVL